MSPTPGVQNPVNPLAQQKGDEKQSKAKLLVTLKSEIAELRQEILKKKSGWQFIKAFSLPMKHISDAIEYIKAIFHAN